MDQEPNNNDGIKSFLKGMVIFCVLLMIGGFFTNASFLFFLPSIIIAFSFMAISFLDSKELNGEMQDFTYDKELNGEAQSLTHDKEAIKPLDYEIPDELFDPEIKEYEEFRIEDSSFGLISIMPSFSIFKYPESRDYLRFYCESTTDGYFEIAISFDSKELDDYRADNYDADVKKIVDGEIIEVEEILNNKALISEIIEQINQINQKSHFLGNEEKAKAIIIDKKYKELYKKVKERFEKPMSLKDFKDILIKEGTMSEWTFYFDKDYKFDDALIQYFSDENSIVDSIIFGHFNSKFELESAW